MKKLQALKVSYDGQIFTQPVINGVATILVGRLPGCDLLLPDSLGLSRAHAIFFYIEAMNTIIVADGGSAFGFQTVWRSHDKEGLKRSVPNDRRCLQFGCDECAMLSLCPGLNNRREFQVS
jgi:hypothetical protein